MSLSKSKIRLSTWIYLSISVLINAFIIVNSSLPNNVSSSFSGFFANIVKSIFNITGSGNTNIINVEGMSLTYDSSYSYNNINGYDENEIVIGKNKRLKVELSPSNASNTAIKYSVSDASIVSINQEGSYLYINGLSIGNVNVTITSQSNDKVSKTYGFNVVDKKAPTNYTTNNIEVFEGSLFRLPITINEEYPEYYDIDKLNIINSDPSIVDVSLIYDGYYQALNVGETSFSINGTDNYIVNVKDKGGAVLPVFASIEGKDSVYSNSSTRYSVDITNEPSLKDVIWIIDDNDYASISNDGLLMVKDIYEEKEVVITAVSLLDTSLSLSKAIKLLPNVITGFSVLVDSYGDVTNKTIQAETGQQIKITINNKVVNNKGVSIFNSNEELAKTYLQGNTILVECIKEGNIRLTLTSIEAPLVSQYVDISIETRGVINRDNYASFAVIVRKSLGHFLLFTLDGIFTLLLFTKLNEIIEYKKKKWWHYIAIVIFIGLFMAFFSEFIQLFIQYRDFTIIDVGIDLLGYGLGMGIILLIRFIKKKHRDKQIAKDTK